MIYHDISLDLSYPRGVNTIYIKYGSTGHFLRAKIFNNGTPYDLSTYNISDIKIYSGQNTNGVNATQKSGNELIFNIDPSSELYTTGWVMCAIEMVKTEIINGVSQSTSTRTQNFQIFSEDTSAPTADSTSTLGGFSPSDRVKIDKIQGGLGNNLGGFALGSGAQTDVNAIQLGEGTNITARTLQVYDKTLLDANGFVPNDRLSLDTSLSTTSVKPVQNKVIKAAVDLKANQKYDTNGGGAIGDTAIATLGGGAVGKTASSSGGGAAIGNTASASTGGAAGKTAETTTGGAIGNSSKSTTGGAIGDDAEATSGGAIGYSSYATSGGAVGNNADEQAGGGAVGNTSSTQSGGAVGNTASSQSGGAVGNNASVTTGGAIGDGASTSIGFAGGYNAKTKNGTTKIDAIQLGTGTNATVKTLQVYDKTLLDADGIIPDARLSDGANTAIEKAHEHTDLSKLDSITASANELNILTGATLSTTELNYVDGVTSNIQSQLDGKASSDHDHDSIYSATGHIHDAATTSVDGFLSKEDKTKIDKFTDSEGKLLYNGSPIAAEITVDNTLSDTSENPVQNKAVASALSNLVSVPSGGTTGQALSKASGVDHDLAWVSPFKTEEYTSESDADLYGYSAKYCNDTFLQVKSQYYANDWSSGLVSTYANGDDATFEALSNYIPSDAVIVSVSVRWTDDHGLTYTDIPLMGCYSKFNQSSSVLLKNTDTIVFGNNAETTSSGGRIYAKVISVYSKGALVSDVVIGQDTVMGFTISYIE